MSDSAHPVIAQMTRASEIERLKGERAAEALAIQEGHGDVRMLEYYDGELAKLADEDKQADWAEEGRRAREQQDAEALARLQRAAKELQLRNHARDRFALIVDAQHHLDALGELLLRLKPLGQEMSSIGQALGHNWHNYSSFGYVVDAISWVLNPFSTDFARPLSSSRQRPLVEQERELLNGLLDDHEAEQDEGGAN